VKTYQNYIINMKWTILPKEVIGIFCVSTEEQINVSCGNNVGVSECFKLVMNVLAANYKIN
jgi:hypothetical protein